MINEIIKFNEQFVLNKEYTKYQTSKYPEKKLAILSCMDARLVELLPAALGIKNGEVKLIKNAGGVVMHPFGSVMRSLLVACYQLGVEEIMVIGHTDCGIQHLDSNALIQTMLDRGIDQKNIDLLHNIGIDFNRWLAGFETVEESVSSTCQVIKNHPLMAQSITIRGFVMDSHTGKLIEVF